MFARLSDPEAAKRGEAMQETLFRMENVEWYRQYYRTATSNAIKMVSEGLPKELESQREEIMAKLRAFLSEDCFFRTMCELTAAQGPLTVFCHGDCWTNNFLFKDGDTDDPEVTNFFSPVSGLLFLFFLLLIVVVVVRFFFFLSRTTRYAELKNNWKVSKSNFTVKLNFYSNHGEKLLARTRWRKYSFRSNLNYYALYNGVTMPLY